MPGSHRSTSARHNDDGDPRRAAQLVSTVSHGLPEQLAGTIDSHLATFAAHVREGLLADSTAVGLAELCARPLGDRRWPSVMLDSVPLDEHLLVIALVVTEDGTKVPMGVVENSTENTEVCARLVANLVDRGLDATRGILFVIDGGKALSKAMRAALGPKALILRCWQKDRDVLAPCPRSSGHHPRQAVCRLGRPRPRRRRRAARTGRTRTDAGEEAAWRRSQPARRARAHPAITGSPCPGRCSRPWSRLTRSSR